MKVSFDASINSPLSSLRVSEDDSAGSITLGDGDTTVTEEDNEENKIDHSSSGSNNSSLNGRMGEVRVSPRPAKKKQDKAKERKKKEEVKTPAHAKGSKVWEAIFPSIIYTWQDVNDNNLCTVEVHMPSGSISSDFHLELEQDESCPNEPQVLLIRYRVGACFFHEEAFDTFITDVVQNVRDASSMSLARHNKIKALKQKYSDKYDIANRHCQMEMRVQLPFLCEDIFSTDDYHGKYENAGSSFRIFNSEDDEQEIVTTHVLIVTLLNKRRKKPEDVLTRNTPQTVKKRGVVTRREE